MATRNFRYNDGSIHTQTTTKDNDTTNAMVTAGKLPASQAETTPQIAPITPAALSPVPSFKITQPQPTAGVSTLLSDIGTQNDLFTQQLAAQKQTAQQNKSSSLDLYLQSLMAPGKTELTNDAYKAEVDPAREELNAITNKINEETIGLTRRLERIDQNKDGMFRDAVIAAKDKAERESLAKQADLSVIQMAKQGQYDLAKSIADRAIDAQVERQTAITNALKTTYEDNKAIFTLAEQREFDTLLADRTARIEDARDQKKQISDLSIAALESGAPTSVVAAMRGATTMEDAIRLGGQYVGALDRQAKQASINASQASAYASSLSARKSILELAQAGEPQAIADLGFDPRDLSAADSQTLAYAQQYAADGKIPTGLKDAGVSFGQIAELAKTLPQPTGSIVSSQTGVKDANVPAAEQGDLNRLYTITQLSKELLELDKGRGDGIVAGTLNKVFGNEQQNAYLTKRKAIVDEIARMQTGAALTVDEQTFYNDYLPGANSNPLGLGTDSSKRIEEFANIMDTKLKNALITNGLSMYGYSTVTIGGQPVTVGSIITNEAGQRGRVNADGSITAL